MTQDISPVKAQILEVCNRFRGKFHVRDVAEQFPDKTLSNIRTQLYQMEKGHLIKGLPSELIKGVNVKFYEGSQDGKYPLESKPACPDTSRGLRHRSPVRPARVASVWDLGSQV